jgi:hypothetical protein
MAQAERNIARRSALVYTAISLAVALIFLAAATLTGYDAVARFGGALWVFMLSMIVTMPVVTSRLKRASR